MAMFWADEEKQNNAARSSRWSDAGKALFVLTMIELAAFIIVGWLIGAFGE